MWSFQPHPCPGGAGIRENGCTAESRTRRPSLLNSCSVRRGGPRALLEEGAEVGFHVQFRLDNIREYRTFDIDASVTWEEGWQISDRYFQSRKDAIGVEMKVIRLGRRLVASKWVSPFGRLRRSIT